MIHWILETLVVFTCLVLLVWQVVFNVLILRPLWISMTTGRLITDLWTMDQIQANVWRSLVWPLYVVRGQRILDLPNQTP